MNAPMTLEREAELRALCDSERGPGGDRFPVAYVAEAIDAMAYERARADAAERRASDLKFALGDVAGWFDRYHAERARADAAEAKLTRVRELCRFQSSGTAHVVLAELDKP